MFKRTDTYNFKIIQIILVYYNNIFIQSIMNSDYKI